MVISTEQQAPETIHHKKRRGQHHKASKHYAKTYWPYLPMLLIVVLGFVVNAGLGSRMGVLSYATNMSLSGLLQETNIQRSGNGREALSLNSQLSRAAQQKASDMASRDYWSHTSPEGTQPWQIISSVGYSYQAAGENLAYGFSDNAGAVAGWMNSPSHRDNLLSTNYKEVGFGIANAANYQGKGEQTIVVAMYANPKKAPAPIAPAAPAPQPPEPAPAPSTPVAQPAPTQEPTPSAAEPAPASDTPLVPATTDTNAPPPISQLDSKEIARVDVLTSGNAQWAAVALAALATIGAITFIYRHAKMWRKLLIRGERFVIKHPVFDTVVVAVIVTGVILTRTTGFIH